MALAYHPCLLIMVVAGIAAAPVVALAATPAVTVTSFSRVLLFVVSVRIFIAKDGFRALLNILTARAESPILAHAIRIQCSLTISSAVLLPCLMLSSFRSDSSTSSSLAKFSLRFVAKSSGSCQVRVPGVRWITVL